MMQGAHSVMQMDREVASFDARYALPNVYDSCAFLGQIQTIGETCNNVAMVFKKQKVFTDSNFPENKLHIVHRK